MKRFPEGVDTRAETWIVSFQGDGTGAPHRVLGDWREEVLVRTEDSSALRLYLSTEVTDITMYTLMHDPQYRVEVARQQTAYNQPSYPGFYLASDTDWSQVPVPGAAG